MSYEQIYLAVAVFVLLLAAFILGRKTAPKSDSMIERIKAMRLHDGDVLVFECESHISAEQANLIRAHFESVMGGKNKAMVLGSGLRVKSVLQRDATEAP